MFQSLPQGIKISITRSIKTAFENYMVSIGWNEDKFEYEGFVNYWRDYSKDNASWFEKLDVETKLNSDFHQEITEKMNETIEKVLSTAPTEEEIKRVEELINELDISDIDFSCKAEAKYQIDKLESQLKKKQNSSELASQKEIKLAEIVYYQAYEKELPKREYTTHTLQQIKEEAQRELDNSRDFDSDNHFPIQ